MNVKEFIKRCMPDSIYLKWQYKAVTGKELNLKNPCTFNEKLQWLKLHDRNPLYTTLVDKYEVKKYVADRIGGQYIIPTLGVWDNFDDIDFAALPKKFVLKCTHDSGSVVICKDKSAFDVEAARKKLEPALKKNYYWLFREWPYKNVKPRIIAEKLMDGGEKGLVDYKFYCFNGKPRFLYISEGLEDHSTAKISFVNLNWSFAPYQRSDYKLFDNLPEKPKTFNEMIKIAGLFSNGMPFVRCDLYEIKGIIYFSELTFSPCGGFTPFKDEKYDYEIGKFLMLPKSRGGDKGIVLFQCSRGELLHDKRILWKLSLCYLLHKKSYIKKICSSA